MLENALHLVFVGATTVAAGIMTLVTLSAAVDLLRWIIERRRPCWLRSINGRRLPTRDAVYEGGGIARLILLGAAALLALKAALTGGVLIAVYLVVIGFALSLYLGQQASSTVHERVTDAVAELVAAYYSAYLVIPTVFGALAEATKTQVNPSLHTAAQRALDGFGAGKTSEEVLEQLVRDVDDPYLSQFAFILSHTSESNQREILNSMRDLTTRLDQRKRLKDRSKVALALVSGTVRFLQMANGAVIALAVIAPFWWGFYSSSYSRQMVLIIAGTIALLGSWYFENQLMQLRERVL
jgi:hypothetical protein